MSRTSTISPRPRVLHCISHLALGGAERVALTLIRELQNDFDFSVFAVRGIDEGEVGQELKNQLGRSAIPMVLGPRIPMRHGGILTGAQALARALHRFTPDLIHLHAEIPEASYSALAALVPHVRQTPLVRTIHNSVIWQFAPRLGRVCDRLMAHGYVAGVSRDAVAAFNRLRATSAAPPPPEPAVTLLNGIEIIDVSPSYPRQRDVIRMIYGGRLEPEKGTDLLPDIVAGTRLPPGIRAHLTIHGSGRHESLLRSLARRPPHGWTVEVLGPVRNFAARLSEFDVVLLPSRYEGLALVALEALRARVQIVATDASGLREALPPHHPWLARAGDAVSFSAALENACANRALWSELAEIGRSFSLGDFTPEKMAAGYRALYRRVLARAAAERQALPVL